MLITCPCCSDVVEQQYMMIYDTMKEVYLKLLSLDLRALVYNGDTDMACNFLGDQWFVEDLGFKVHPENILFKSLNTKLLKCTKTCTHFIDL